jgi:hypothetical protein
MRDIHDGNSTFCGIKAHWLNQLEHDYAMDTTYRRKDHFLLHFQHSQTPVARPEHRKYTSVTSA